MIVYFDTSAFVPLLVSEAASDVCRRLWDEADDILTSRLLYVETAAALAQAARLGRMTAPQHQATLRATNRLWGEFAVVEADSSVVARAAELARQCELRGYDAVHCASAEQVDDDSLVVASGDLRLLAACRDLGLATADVNS